MSAFHEALSFADPENKCRFQVEDAVLFTTAEPSLEEDNSDLIQQDSLRFAGNNVLFDALVLDVERRLNEVLAKIQLLVRQQCTSAFGQCCFCLTILKHLLCKLGTNFD